MKIGVLFEGTSSMGGSFYQSLKLSLMINEIEEYKTKIKFIILDKQLEIFLKKKDSKLIFIITIYYQNIFANE